jgi:hypothetical protein
VSAEDQGAINLFSKHNQRLDEVESLIGVKKVCTAVMRAVLDAKLTILQEEREALDDLATELELADEDELIP